MNRPNILYLHSHDTGRFVQPYGHAISTPNIQHLAQQGIVFRQAFCAGPTCSPSRAGLLTGQSPHSSGMIGLAHRGFELHDYRHHILHTLRSVGYYSALIGVQHVAPDPSMIGYDRIVEVENHRADKVAPAAADFLSSPPAQPFFLSVGFFETHREFPSPAPSEDPQYCLPPPPLPDTPQTRCDMAALKASARLLDQGMGVVLDALDASGLAEETLVICTTDHGIAFPGMKCNLTDHGTGVMLILRGPGGFDGGRVCDAMVSQIDLFPTICEMLEIEPPSWLEGSSMMPLIRKQAQQIHDEVFSEVTYHASYEPQRSVRTARWKYIRRYGDRRSPVLPNCDDSASKDVWMNHGWGERSVEPEQLYDLIFDPNEAHNLVDDPSAQSTVSEMRDRLARWMQATNDPLLQGRVAAPPGARVNDPDGVSPSEPTIPAS